MWPEFIHDLCEPCGGGAVKDLHDTERVGGEMGVLPLNNTPTLSWLAKGALLPNAHISFEKVGVTSRGWLPMHGDRGLLLKRVGHGLARFSLQGCGCGAWPGAWAGVAGSSVWSSAGLSRPTEAECSGVGAKSWSSPRPSTSSDPHAWSTSSPHPGPTTGRAPSPTRPSSGPGCPGGGQWLCMGRRAAASHSSLGLAPTPASIPPWDADSGRLHRECLPPEERRRGEGRGSVLAETAGCGCA